jgi:GNAT superfamily N-acetyltransferase
MFDIVYYKAEEADIDMLVNRRVDFLSEHFGMHTEEAVADLKKHLQVYFHDHLNKTYICWLAKDVEEVVGIGGMTIREHPGSFRNPTGRMGYIMNMYTLPAYRNRGIAYTILEKLIASGKQLGINMFELHATRLGEPVYLKYGFQLHSEPTYRLRFD